MRLGPPAGPFIFRKNYNSYNAKEDLKMAKLVSIIIFVGIPMAIVCIPQFLVRVIAFMAYWLLIMLFGNVKF